VSANQESILRLAAALLAVVLLTAGILLPVHWFYRGTGLALGIAFAMYALRGRGTPGMKCDRCEGAAFVFLTQMVDGKMTKSCFCK
jgi:hypothetical protein